MLNSSLWEAAVWFCIWTVQEQGACTGEPCTSRVLHRVTGYSWQWGPECECLSSRTKAEEGRLAEGSCYPSCPSILTFIPGYWWPCYPWSALASPKPFLPLHLGSIQTSTKMLWSATMWVHVAASPANRIPTSFLSLLSGELLRLPPLPCVSHCLQTPRLSNEACLLCNNNIPKSSAFLQVIKPNTWFICLITGMYHDSNFFFSFLLCLTVTCCVWLMDPLCMLLLTCVK